ncbi:hypothetical protein KBD20_01325 [Candidatus Saccharibacteria bacterium]|nr:hypothetical protein [Candidatus Saccharibacteria bacterium]
MARLPVPGSDDGTWGAVLNEFLTESHNNDGSLKPESVESSGVALRRTAKFLHAGEISGLVQDWNPTGWDGGAGDVDVILVDPVLSEPPSWQASTFYTPALLSYGSIVYENGEYWQAMPSSGTTGSVQPIAIHPTIADGTIAYSESFVLLNGDGVWPASTAVYGYSYIIADGYVWETYSTGNTGGTTPDWASGPSIIDGDITWSRRGPVYIWQANLTISYNPEDGEPFMRLPGGPNVYRFFPISGGTLQSGTSKPSFTYGEYDIDNDILWQSASGQTVVMPHLLSLSSASAEDGRRVTIHFTGNIIGVMSGSGSGFGSGLNPTFGTSPGYTTIGIPTYMQTLPANAIEGSFVLSTGSVELMWDAGASIWRIIGGGNEIGFPLFN